MSAQRHGHQGEDQASKGKRQPTLKFHPCFAPIFAILGKEFPCRPLGIAQGAQLIGNEAGDFNRPIALAEIGERIVIRILPVDLVRGTALKVQLKLALFRLGNYNRILRQGQL